jgi:tetratricopeptide (TPR) repeat protein
MKLRITTLKYFLILCAIVLSRTGFSQSAIDSLRTELNKNLSDTSRAITLQEMGMQFYLDQPDTAIKYWREGISFVDKKIKNKKGEEKRVLLYAQSILMGSLAYMFSGTAKNDSALMLMERSIDVLNEIKEFKAASQILNNLGSLLIGQGKYEEALRVQNRALGYAQSEKDFVTVGFVLQNIGLIYSTQGNFPMALNYFNRSLKIRDSIKDYLGLGHAYYELAILYNSMDEIKPSLEYFQKSLAARLKGNDIGGASATEAEICAIYLNDLNNPSEAKKYLDAALIHAKHQNDLFRLGYLFAHAGDYFYQTGKKDSAVYYFQKAAAVRKEAGELKGYSMSLYLLGTVAFDEGDYDKAIELGLKAFDIGEKNKISETMRKASDLLRQSYSKKRNWEKAYHYFEFYKTYSDTLLNKSNQRKSLSSRMNFEFEKKEHEEKAAHEKKEIEHTAENKRQQQIIIFIIVTLVLVLIFSAYIFNRMHVIRKQRNEIHLHQQETEKQKMIIEEKQTEIIDSLLYARRIQSALIASEKYIERQLKRLNNKS